MKSVAAHAIGDILDSVMDEVFTNTHLHKFAPNGPLPGYLAAALLIDADAGTDPVVVLREEWKRRNADRLNRPRSKPHTTPFGQLDMPRRFYWSLQVSVIKTLLCEPVEGQGGDS